MWQNLLLGVAQMQRIQFSAKLVKFKGFGFNSRIEIVLSQCCIKMDGWIYVCMHK